MSTRAAAPAGMPLKAYLARLIGLCVLPLLLLAAWLAYERVHADQIQRNQEAANLARNFAVAIDQHLDERIRALNLLAASPLIEDRAHWPDLYRQAQAFRESFGGHVILADPGPPLRMLFNTRLPYGAPLPELPRPAGHAAAPAAVASGKPAVGDTFVGPVANEPLVAIAVPALRQGKVAFVVIAVIETRRFQQRLDLLALPAGWTITLRDGRGEAIARRAPAQSDAAPQVDSGGRIVVASQVAPWSVVVEVPRQARRAPLLATAIALACGLLAATLAGVLGALAASRRLGRELGALAHTGTAAAAPTIAEIATVRRLLDAASGGLRASEERLRRLFREAPVPMIHVADDGAIAAQNARFEQVFGYAPADLPGIADWWRLACPDADYRARMMARFQAAQRASGAGTDIDVGECRVQCKDGSERIVQISAIAVNGGMLATFFDLTAQRRAEARLRLWAESFEQANFGLVISDAHSNTVAAANPAFARERGYRREDMIGMPIGELFPAERAGELRELIAQLDAHGHGVFETEHVTRDGQRFPVLLDVTVLRDTEGRPVNRIAYALDLRARKRAEQALAAAQAAALEQQRQARLAALNQMEDATAARARAEAALGALRESEERLTLFIEHAPAALAMFDRDMRYLAASRRWLDDYGLGGQDLRGRCHYEVFPEIGESWKAVHARGLAGETVRADEDRFARADGAVCWLRWEVHPWHAADGTVGGIVIFTEDITRQRRAEEHIRELNAGLERRVAERTAELTAANKELDSFAYAVSHDLRAPLRAMNGFSQALLEDYGPELPDAATSYLSQIITASRKMGELIDGILTLSRSARGEMRCDTIDLSALAARRLAALAQAEPQRRVAWQVQPGLTATGDARMIEAALGNLLDNAWKYTGRTADAQIRFYAGSVGGEPGFCVADNGAGFDLAYAERLFKPFQRLHRQDEFPGTGVGLATVQRIIHRHGGEITACAEPGKGATFCFTLPDSPRKGVAP